MIKNHFFVAPCARPAEDGRLHILETAVPAVIRALCRDNPETISKNRKVIVLLACVLSLLAGVPASAAAADEPLLLPWPRQAQFGGSPIRLPAVNLQAGEFAGTAAEEDLTALFPPAEGAPDGSVRILMERAAPDRAAVWQPAPDQGYILEITAGQGTVPVIRILALGEAGAFYAVQTLRQLVSGEAGQREVRTCRIEDWPGVRWRGFKLLSAPMNRFYSRYKMNFAWSYIGLSISNAVPAVTNASAKHITGPKLDDLDTTLKGSAGKELPMDDLLLDEPAKPVPPVPVPPPVEKQAPVINPPKLAEAVAAFRRLHGSVAVSFNPGGTLNLTPDFMDCVRQLYQSCQRQGVEHFVLSLDDMAAGMAPETAALYGTYSKARAALVHAIHAAVGGQDRQARVYLCPQAYFGIPAAPATGTQSPHSEGLPETLRMVWTGTGIFTQGLSGESTAKFIAAWQRPLGIFYHNWPIGASRPETGPLIPHEPGAARQMDAYMMCSDRKIVTHLAFLSGLDWAWNPEGYDQARSARAVAHFWARESGSSPAAEAQLAAVLQWQGTHSALEIIGGDTKRTPEELKASVEQEKALFAEALPVLRAELKTPAVAASKSGVADELEPWWTGKRMPLLDSTLQLQGSRRTGIAVQARTPPVVDGMLEDAAWAGVPVLDGFTAMGGRTPVALGFETRLRMIYDQDWIYVALECGDPEVNRIVNYQGDGWKMKNGDHVQLLFDHTQSFGRPAIIAVTKSGAGLFDFGYKWARGLECKTVTGAAGWTAELRIPLAALREAAPGACPVPGVNWSFNAQRLQSYQGWSTGTWSAWSPAPRSDFSLQYGGLLNFE